MNSGDSHGPGAGPAYSTDEAQVDAQLLEGAPRLFAIVADPEGGRGPRVIAWGHELPEQAVLTWRLSAGGASAGSGSMGVGSEVAVFRSAQAALAVAQLICPARLLWATPATEGV